jgi:TonB-linked SusC/RagA family outer membrane protein
MLLLTTSYVSASTGYSQTLRIDLSMNNVALPQVFNEIERRSEFSIIYKSEEVSPTERVSVNVSQQTVDAILSAVLRDTHLKYIINDRHIIVYKEEYHNVMSGQRPAPAPQQNRRHVTGAVTDAAGEPVIGATVMEKGTQNGTVTAMDGTFALDIENVSGRTLVFSYIGHARREVSVGNSPVVNVVLEEDVQRLDDIVVIGYAVGNKRSISGVVEKIRREDMNTGIVTEPLDALKGRVAGVVITGAGGDPTLDLNIRIRGTTSLSGGNDPLVIVDGVFGDLNMLRALSSSDIESLTILKDASETAQYGSRGASGVIVVTTQKGRAGFSQVEYNGLFGASMVYKNIEMLSAGEWRAGVASLGVSAEDRGASTNWAEEIQRATRLTQTHNLSFTSGNETSNMRASLGVVSNPGLLKNSSSNNYTVKMDGSQYAFNKKVKIDLGVLGSRREEDMQYDMYRTFYSAASYNPTYPNYKNPVTGIWDEDPVAIETYNPLGMLDISNKNFVSQINVNGRINYEIAGGLNLSLFGTYTNSQWANRRYIPNDIQQGLMNGHGQAYVQNRERSSLMGNIQLSYAREIGKHSINALALLEAQKQNGFESATTASGFETNYFKYNNMQAAANVTWGNATSSASTYKLLSYMVRGNYMYDGKYVATVNVRRDGSSKLGSGNKWGLFPSASAAWIVSNESFLSDVRAINNLKIRAGYGVTGNQDAIEPYNSLSLMNPNGTTLVDGIATTTFAINSNSNAELRWEKKYTFDAGVDLVIFDSRLRFTADYYASRTKDMLYSYSVPVPPFVYTTMLANLGEMSNNGFELSVNGDVVKNKDFTFSIGANMAVQKNKLESLSGTYMGTDFTTSKYIQLAYVNAQGLTQYAGVTYLTEGEPIGVFYIPHANGLMDVDGKNLYDIDDINEDGKVDLSDSGSGDRYIAGQSIPKVYVGGSISLRYKSFDLIAQLNGAFGHMIYNGTSLTFNNLSSFPSYNVQKGALEKNIYDIKVSDYYLEKGDYMNIEYITLGYNIPNDKLNTKFIKSLRLALSVNNVATITGYSGLTPLINSSNMTSRSAGRRSSGSPTLGLDDKLIYPLSRVYSLSLGIKF